MAQQKSHGKPRLACEVSAERVVAARLSETGEYVEMHSIRTLPTGTVVPSLVNPNVLQPAQLRQAIEEAMAAIAGRSRDVIAVLPDAAVRVMLLDFEDLPQNQDEAAGVIRFRLRKSLPFDVDKSRVSFQAQRLATGVRVVAAIALASIVEEYESAFVQAGYAPGIVLPSSLAALGMVDGTRPTLVLKVSDSLTTIAIVDNQELRLFRTLEQVGRPDMQGEQLAEHAYPSVVFFQDNFGANIERILIAGVSSLQQIATSLEAQTGT